MNEELIKLFQNKDFVAKTATATKQRLQQIQMQQKQQNKTE